MLIFVILSVKISQKKISQRSEILRTGISRFSTFEIFNHRHRYVFTFPRFKNQFLRECNRRTMNILPRLFSRYYHLLVSCTTSIYSAQRRFCSALSLIPIFASGPFHFSRFLLCHTRISSNSIRSGIWRFSILRFRRSLRDIIVDIFIRRQSLFSLFLSLSE